MAKNHLGLTKEVAAALSYILGPITGVIFYLLYKHEPFVRFHAAQAIVGLGLIMLAAIMFSFFPIIGSLISILYFVALIAGAYNASQGVKWEMPVVGKFTKKLLKTS